jgi:nucleoid DNA-binding protein
MKRDQLTRELAREAGVPAAAARDQIDELVHKIIHKLQRGQPVRLPGMGKLVAGPVKRRGGR